jgi:hypothetical protein
MTARNHNPHLPLYGGGRRIAKRCRREEDVFRRLNTAPSRHAPDQVRGAPTSPMKGEVKKD